MPVAQHAAADAQNHRSVPGHQTGEGSLIAPGYEAFQELLVHYRLAPREPSVPVQGPPGAIPVSRPGSSSISYSGPGRDPRYVILRISESARYLGEFPSAVDRPELGQDEGPWEGEIAVPDDPAE